MSKPRPVTIVDIAEAAGVSIATVSNVLNRRNVPMSEDTIRKVEQTAKELGYRRNVVAANLSRQKSYELGLVVPSLGGYYARFAEEMERTAHAHGYHLSVFSAGGFNPDIERRHLEMLLQRRVDGLFCHGLAMSPASTRAIVGEGTPLVLFNGWGWPEDLAAGAANLDFAGGCREAVRHLVEQGCRHLFYISRSRSLATNEQRLEGFLAGVREYADGLPHDVVELNGTNYELVFEQVREQAGEAWPIGVLGFDDTTALAFMSRVLEHGLRVPEQVKIVGINDDFIASACYPALTTLAIPYDKQAQLAVGLMIRELEGKPLQLDGTAEGEGGRELRIPIRLIERRSTQ